MLGTISSCGFTHFWGSNNYLGQQDGVCSKCVLDNVYGTCHSMLVGYIHCWCGSFHGICLLGKINNIACFIYFFDHLRCFPSFIVDQTRDDFFSALVLNENPPNRHLSVRLHILFDPITLNCTLQSHL